jgi:hypothetical protein
LVQHLTDGFPKTLLNFYFNKKTAIVEACAIARSFTTWDKNFAGVPKTGRQLNDGAVDTGDKIYPRFFSVISTDFIMK